MPQHEHAAGNVSPILIIVATAVMSLAAVGVGTPAHAQPMFPDLSGYTPVNVADFTIAIPNPGGGSSNSIFFLTPDANACMLVDAAAKCTGNNFPGMPRDTETSAQDEQPGWADRSAFSR